MIIVRRMGPSPWADREEEHLSQSPDYLMEMGCALSVLPMPYMGEQDSEDLQEHVTPLQLLFE